ncbi:MAG: hypothetical protein H7831_17550 [Magnetococcus sp. WYHC-3]
MVTWHERKMKAVKPPSAEKHGGKSKVEKLEYVPLETRINALLQAGGVLRRARAEMHDTLDPDADPEDIVAPVTRSGDFDLADHAVEARKIAQRMIAREQQREAAKSAKADQKVPVTGDASASAEG